WLDNIRLPFGTTISGLSGTEINSDQTIVYPNPGNGLFRVRATDFIAEAWTITDLAGRIVLSGNASASTGQEIQVDGSRLPSGHYIIGLAGKQGVRQARICVVNP
ncbi:MAG: T9SS type A sorting domain-containing protein, partial [Bacteroidota bacterium]